MYSKVNTNLNFVERERETLKFWNENDIFKKQLAESEGRPGYTLYAETRCAALAEIIP